MTSTDQHATPPLRPGWPSGYVAALAMVAAATLCGLAVRQMVGAPNLSLIFVLPVVVAALGFGWRPAVLAAAAGVLAFNFFLIEPRYTLRVADPANAWALMLLSVVAALVSAVAAQARARSQEARRTVSQALALQGLSRALMAAGDRDAVARAGAEALARLFEAPAVILLEEDDGLGPPTAARGADLGPEDLDAARWALASRLPSRAGAYPVDGAAFDFWPLVSPSRRRGVLGLRLSGDDRVRPADPDPLVEIVGGHLCVALDRDALAAQAVEDRVALEGQRLKSDLLAAVSHDLKTPLSTILFTLQSLQRYADRHDEAARAGLLALAEAETDRLSRLVANLLDMGRLDADAVVVRPAAMAPADLAADAAHRAAAALAGRDLVMRIDAAAPPLWTDPGLAETALANLLDNAGKYAPASSLVILAFHATSDSAVFEVIDEGPGFTGPIAPLFEKFSRGVQGDGRAPGTGLGLSIARGFAEALGGRLEAENREDRVGARLRLILPAAPAPEGAA